MIHHILFSALLVLSSCDKTDARHGLPLWSVDTELTGAKQPNRVFVTADLRYVVFLVADPGSSDRLTPVTVALNNGAIPTFRISVTASENNYEYHYAVSNDRAAKDSIFGVSIVVPGLLPGTTAGYKPSKPDSRQWDGYVNFAIMDRPNEMGAHVSGRTILWMPHGESDQVDTGKLNIQPGETVEGLRIISPLMPGFTTGKTSGLPYTPPEEAVDDNGVGKTLTQLDDYFETTTLTFGPMFLPDAPPSDVLANYRTGIARLNKCAGIAHTPGFINELDEILQEAGIELKLAERLAHMQSQPRSSIEEDLLRCLRLVGDSWARASQKK